MKYAAYADLSLIVTFSGQDVKHQRNALSDGNTSSLKNVLPLYLANYQNRPESPVLTFQFCPQCTEGQRDAARHSCHSLALCNFLIS